MSLYRVDKREQPVVLFMSDGVVREGVFFLSPFSQSHSGEQTLLELLRGTDTFVAFRGTDDVFCLINKEVISHLRYPLEPDQELAGYGEPQGVRMVFFGGEVLQGTIHLAMPEGQNRLLDYVNAAPGFFPLDSGEAHYIVNAALIREISPQR